MSNQWTANTFHDCGKAFSEGRIRILWVNPLDILTMLYRVHQDYNGLAFKTIADLPEDVQVVSVSAEWAPHRIGMMLCHPSFDPVPPGEEPPVIRHVHQKVVLLRRLPNESGMECYLVPTKEEGEG